MTKTATESYLAGDVFTATPQKLQLMLIDAAIRHAEQARKHWSDGASDAACVALVRAQEIIGEMVASLDYEADSDFVRNVASLYLFIHRCFVEANLAREETKLDDALRVLRIERETWRQVCEAYPGKVAEPSRADPPHPTTPAPAFDTAGESSYRGLSLEA
jgi:flagellar secretion chaperone FliS